MVKETGPVASKFKVTDFVRLRSDLTEEELRRFSGVMKKGETRQVTDVVLEADGVFMVYAINQEGIIEKAAEGNLELAPDPGLEFPLPIAKRLFGPPDETK